MYVGYSCTNNNDGLMDNMNNKINKREIKQLMEEKKKNKTLKSDEEINITRQFLSILVNHLSQSNDSN